MAERRMFAKTIIDSDAFLEMPQSTQLLYFHLAMRADDDGFINKPKSIMREVGCKEDDIKILSAKKFIIPFESGVVVIKHWRMHNYIQGDRYHETKYKEEKASLILDDNKAYKALESHVSRMETECIQNVSIMETQVRLGKDRIGKDSNIPALQVFADEQNGLYKQLWDSFLGQTKAFANYGKEGQANKKLVELFKARLPEEPDKLAALVLQRFLELTQGGDKFWKAQPFLPSALLSLFDRVMKDLENNRPWSAEDYAYDEEIPL
jgi:hypothetical protein